MSRIELQHYENDEKKCGIALTGGAGNADGTTFMERYHQQTKAGETFDFASFQEAPARKLPKGVYVNGKKFRAQIKFQRKDCSLGTYGTVEQAEDMFQLAEAKKNLHDKDPSFDINEFKKFVKGAKKTVMEKALATVEESQTEEEDGSQETQVGGATVSTTATAATNAVPSATTNADANPNGNAAAVPAETDNATAVIAPVGESTGGLKNESDAALADDDDDDAFPVANGDTFPIEGPARKEDTENVIVLD